VSGFSRTVTVTTHVNSTLRIGTRGSPLALYQANSVAALLRDRTGMLCEIVVIKTSGDRLGEAPLSEAGGKRLFVKEIEDALLAGDVDLAVHSSKDMPALLPDGLAIAGVLPREDPRDALVLPAGHDFEEDLDRVRATLGAAPRIGTSSVRRIAQLASFTSAGQFLPVRGNLDTRLRKLDSGDYDALVLAAAGLRRLERDKRISALLPVDLCVPAPGQGIIAIEIRENDHRASDMIKAIDDANAATALKAERAVVDRLGGGCQMPIGAFAHAINQDTLSITSIVVSTDGGRSVRATVHGSTAAPEQLGRQAADELLAKGAESILIDARHALRPRAPSAAESHQS
jgi:hydroxymethylbilane synthase